MKELQFEFRWSRLKDSSGGEFIYGNELGKLRSHISRPAIYRWVIEDGGRKIKMYVGETEKLGRRLYQYLNPRPTQYTNLRLRGEFLSANEQGQKAYREILEFEPFTFNGVMISAEELSKKHVRRLLEALTCLQVDAGVKSVNR